MNYKKIAFVLCLVPMMSCAGDVQETIKELKKEQLEKEAQIVILNKRIKDEFDYLILYKTTAFNEWTVKTQEEFNAYIIEILRAFSAGREIKSLIEKNTSFDKNPFYSNAYISRIIIQSIYVERMIDSSQELVEELRLINKKLNDLYEQN